MSDTDRWLKAPYPYFGGKRSVANEVWKRLGAIDNFIEPFAGSLAVLLARPQPFAGVETANDLNGYITNVWRAIQADPDAVAAYCDWPVSELDLHARHRWLVYSDEAVAFRERLRADPECFDARIAGWWIHGACCWIGAGWCDTPYKSRPSINHATNGVLRSAHQPKKRPRDDRAAGGSNSPCALPGVLAGPALAAKVPDLASGGSGDAAPTMSQQLPRMGSDVALLAGPHLSEQVPLKRGTCSGSHGAGVNSSGRPQLADAYDVGRGVNSQGEIGTCEARRAWLVGWMRALSDRLRLVRICCGHWLRVCDSDSVTIRLGTTGIFLDPPYPMRRKDTGATSRSEGLYQNDDADTLDSLRDEVLAYCRERGDHKQYRICLACYEGDGYEPLLTEHGWTEYAWEAQGGYGNRGKKKANRKRERLLFSPRCAIEPTLFDALDPQESTP